MTDTHDAVIVCSGVNALVAGALLARDGWSVAVCEHNELPGGAICTREDVFPGYIVELLSSWHPFWSPPGSATSSVTVGGSGPAGCGASTGAMYQGAAY
jgi:phytoene dehydrogenase-like protein